MATPEEEEGWRSGFEAATQAPTHRLKLVGSPPAITNSHVGLVQRDEITTVRRRKSADRYSHNPRLALHWLCESLEKPVRFNAVWRRGIYKAKALNFPWPLEWRILPARIAMESSTLQDRRNALFPESRDPVSEYGAEIWYRARPAQFSFCQSKVLRRSKLLGERFGSSLSPANQTHFGQHGRMAI
jgi:hypothetical protein